MSPKGIKRRRVEGSTNDSSTIVGSLSPASWSDMPSCVAVLQKPRESSSPSVLLELATQLTNALVADMRLQNPPINAASAIHRSPTSRETPSRSFDVARMERSISRHGKRRSSLHEGNTINGTRTIVRQGDFTIEESLLDFGTADDTDDDEYLHVGGDDDDDDDNNDGDGGDNNNSNIDNRNNNNNNDNKDNDNRNSGTPAETVEVIEIEPMTNTNSNHAKTSQSKTGSKIEHQLTNIKKPNIQENVPQKLEIASSKQAVNVVPEESTPLPWWRSSRTRVTVSDHPTNEVDLIRGYISAVAHACLLESYNKISLRDTFDRDPGSPRGVGFRATSSSLLLLERARHMGHAREQFGSSLMHTLLNRKHLTWDFISTNSANYSHSSQANGQSPLRDVVDNPLKFSASSSSSIRSRTKIRNTHPSKVADFIGCELCGEFRLARCRISLSGQCNGRDWWPEPLQLGVLSRKMEPADERFRSVEERIHSTFAVTVELGLGLNGHNQDDDDDDDDDISNDMGNGESTGGMLNGGAQGSSSSRHKTNGYHGEQDGRQNRDNGVDLSLSASSSDDLLVDEQCLRKVVVFHRLVHATQSIANAIHAGVEDEVRDGVVRVRLPQGRPPRVEDVRETLAKLCTRQRDLMSGETEQVQNLLRLGDLYFSGQDAVMLASGLGLDKDDGPGVYDEPLYLADEDHEQVVKQLLAEHRVVQT